MGRLHPKTHIQEKTSYKTVIVAKILRQYSRNEIQQQKRRRAWEHGS
jgi:hypothetical protein